MFRFTIRDVLWLTVVVAMGVGWVVDHRSQSRRVQSAEDGALLVIGEALDDFPRVGAKWQLTPRDQARLKELRSGHSN